ncbi:carboxylesterase type B [Nocardia tenerifensis]|uniref:Carboxylic ester hydrolase n=2 Tax=Nocardia tenerifensis TaxID=228006 RepID=A0A318JVY8_9NOCA|nr:carboxylesterase type B [Nocardia tenerifensis]
MYDDVIREEGSVSMKRVCLALAAVALTVAYTGCATDEAAADDTVVAIDSGSVRGVISGDYRSFAGIPFAAPPIGEHRWAPPQPVSPWTGVRAAEKPGPACMQPQSDAAPVEMSEDCLYLNVTTPRAARDLPRPVLVWLHGGGFFEGQGAEYDARRLVGGGDVVVVTVNYRLGLFGLFHHPELGTQGGDFAIQDQQAALRWVRSNIARFGGDPRNVTVAGESAGAMSTCTHLVAPGSAGLFDKAIIASGSCTMSWPKNSLIPGMPEVAPWLPAAEAQTTGVTVGTEHGCADGRAALDCLRAVPTEALMDAFTDFTRVSYGTATVPTEPSAALRTGEFARVPIMQGNTRDEHSSWAAAAQMEQPIDRDRYGALLVAMFDDRAARVEAQYPVDDYASPAAALSAVLTDRTWLCPTLRANAELAERTTVYGFEFADRAAPPIAAFPPEVPPGASHGSDLSYLFDVSGVGSATALDPAQLQLSDRMIAYWTRFAATGDPNTTDLPPWQPFRTSDQVPYVQSLAPEKIGPVDLATEHRCHFWQEQTR